MRRGGFYLQLLRFPVWEDGDVASLPVTLVPMTMKVNVAGVEWYQQLCGMEISSMKWMDMQIISTSLQQ